MLFISLIIVIMQQKSEKGTASARQQKFYHRLGSGGYNYLKKKVGDNYTLAAGEAKEPVKGLDKKTAHYLLQGRRRERTGHTVCPTNVYPL